MHHVDFLLEQIFGGNYTPNLVKSFKLLGLGFDHPLALEM